MDLFFPVVCSWQGLCWIQTWISQKGERVKHFVILLLKSFPSVCTLSSLLSLLLRPPLTPSSRLPSPFSPPFQLVHPAQVWLRKRCVSLPCEPAQCAFVSVKVCVCIMPCHFEWCHVFLFLAWFLLDSSMCSAAPPLCRSPVLIHSSLSFLSVSSWCLFLSDF